MYAFAGITTTLYNETSAEQYSLSSCGSDLFDMHGGCCFSSIDPSSFSGFSSLVQREAFTDKPNFPVSAKGYKYCHLQAIANGSLYGLSDIWYKNDFACIDSYFACGSNGQFKRYSQPGCLGSSKSIQLASKATSFDFGDMGNVTGEFITLSAASEVYEWTAFIPAALLIYRYQVPMEIIALICYMGGISISLGVLAYSIEKFIKTRSLYLTVVMVSQLLWVLWISMDFGYYNILFPTDDSTMAYNEIDGCLFNLAALTTVFNTANFIIGFKNVTSIGFKIAIYSGIVLVHIIFAGGNYFNYMFLSYGSGTIWQKWLLLLPVWSLLMFTFNTIPAFTIAIPLVKSTEDMQRVSTLTAVKVLLVIDGTFAVLFLLQILNTISIVVSYSVQQYTLIPGSDRNFLSMSGIFALNYAIHAGINCLFIEHLRSVLLSTTTFSSSSNSVSIIGLNALEIPDAKLLNKVYD
ncbi:hypothetical protein HDV01_003635 [Terramyces sp. JEL0728]|nr:hypothetical protein HDV01_003635 [Terramyces sp. JEL0728]